MTKLTNEERVRIMAWLIHDLYISRGLPYPPKDVGSLQKWLNDEKENAKN